jgi:hypothetical protein
VRFVRVVAGFVSDQAVETVRRIFQLRKLG